jgi:DNA-binding phage protein
MRHFQQAMGEERLSQKFAAILPLLNERQRRLILAIEAKALGRGGVTRVARASGVSRMTIQKAMRELETGVVQDSAVRQ